MSAEAHVVQTFSEARTVAEALGLRAGFANSMFYVDCMGADGSLTRERFETADEFRAFVRGFAASRDEQHALREPEA